jgi:hypothetical protein
MTPTTKDGFYEPVDTSLLPATRVDAANLIRALQQLEVIAKRQAPRIAFTKYRRAWVAEIPTRPATKKSGVYCVCKPKPIA